MLLGIAYKGDIDDLRESPALKVWSELEKKGAKVEYYDPYCKNAKWKNSAIESVNLTPNIVASYDAVVITTWHKHNIDYKLVLDNAKILFDTKNAVVSVLGEETLKNANLYRL